MMKHALLKEHGGPLGIGKSWAATPMLRIHMVKKKDIRAAHKIPSDFKDVKMVFLSRVSLYLVVDGQLLLRDQSKWKSEALTTNVRRQFYR